MTRDASPVSEPRGAAAYPRLFGPLQIGPVTSRNRVVNGAHFTMFTEPSSTFGEPGFYGARYGRYLGERAAGGAGVVIAGQAAVHPTTAYQMVNNAVAWDEACVPGLREVVEPIREAGALPFLQLAHNGGVNDGRWSKLPVLAPSYVANYYEPPRPMTTDDIREVIDGFVASARNAVRAGFAGIEIHAAHGYLAHEFLSPLHNLRDDDYGGSFDGRMRFLEEVLQATRDAVGSEVAVGIRLVGDERDHLGRGLTAKDAAQIAARLEHHGLVDFLDVSVGASGIGMVRPMYARPLFGVYAAAEVKNAVSRTPVFAVHRIRTPEEAEGILARNEADAVTLVRALIADPRWPEKARTGQARRIRPCTGCNQDCYGNLTSGRPISCTTNPIVGREAWLGDETMPPADRQRRVVVVGGGPAGLEAARMSAVRGHQVILLEREAELGGAIRLAARLPGREEMLGFVTWRIDELHHAGVEVRLQVDTDAAIIGELSPDLVIMAVGAQGDVTVPSKFFQPVVPGLTGGRVVDHVAAVEDPSIVGQRVLIVDVVGHIEGFGIAELLAVDGRHVTLSSPLATPLMLDAETTTEVARRCARAGVVSRPNTVFAGIDGNKASLLDLSSRHLEAVEVDSVVLRTHARPRHAFREELTRSGLDVCVVGDAVSARTVDRAIHDGHVAGRQA